MSYIGKVVGLYIGQFPIFITSYLTAFKSHSFLALFNFLFFFCSVRDFSYLSKRNVIRKNNIQKFLAFCCYS